MKMTQTVLKSTGAGELPFLIERIDEEGNKTILDYKKIFPL